MQDHVSKNAVDQTERQSKWFISAAIPKYYLFTERSQTCSLSNTTQINYHHPKKKKKLSLEDRWEGMNQILTPW